jgi:hypothetical protein
MSESADDLYCIKHEDKAPQPMIIHIDESVVGCWCTYCLVELLDRELGPMQRREKAER